MLDALGGFISHMVGHSVALPQGGDEHAGYLPAEEGEGGRHRGRAEQHGVKPQRLPRVEDADGTQVSSPVEGQADTWADQGGEWGRASVKVGILLWGFW